MGGAGADILREVASTRNGACHYASGHPPNTMVLGQSRNRALRVIDLSQRSQFLRKIQRAFDASWFNVVITMARLRSEPVIAATRQI